METGHELERRFDGLLEAAPDAVVIVDDHGRIVLANAQTEILFGYPRSELVGREVEILVPERFRGQHVHDRLAYQRHPRTRPMALGRDLCGRRKDGGEFSAEISLSPVTLPELGSFVIATVRDVTERKRLMGELERRQAEARKARELAELQKNILATLSHEFQTPLAVILGDAELLQERYPEEPLLGSLQDGVKRLSRHTNRLLDYAALISSACSLYKTDVSVREIVDAARAEKKEALAAKDLTLEVRIEPEAAIVQADEPRLAQMVAALLDNACRVSPTKGTIALTARREGGFVRIDVRDQGPGIRPEAQRMVWEPFNPTRAGAPGAGAGLGLSLAIVKLVARLHGGDVALESVPGKGSCFSILLPT